MMVSRLTTDCSRFGNSVNFRYSVVDTCGLLPRAACLDTQHGNCAAIDGPRRRAFSFAGGGTFPQAGQNRGRWLPANAPILPVETHPASFVASGLFAQVSA